MVMYVMKKDGTEDCRYRSNAQGPLVGFNRITKKGFPDKRYISSALCAGKRKDRL